MNRLDSFGVYATVAAIAAVALLMFAAVGRVHDWSPLGLVLSGFVSGLAFAMACAAIYLDGEDDDATA